MSRGAPLPRQRASALGIDERRVLALLDAVEERGVRMRSITIARHGSIGIDLCWAPHDPRRPIHTHSFTKSVVAMVAGCLVEDGLLSTGDRVLDLLPEYRKGLRDPDGSLAEMRVEHLLSMTTGHLSEPPKQGVDDELLAFLETPMEAMPGERFFYTSAGVNVLSAILERVGGAGLGKLMRERVLGPIGVGDHGMEVTQSGHGKGSGGLTLTTEDMCRVCLLLLQDGHWEGERVIPEGWARRMGSVEFETPIMAAPRAWEGLRQGYGLLTWGCPDVGARVLYGLNGQFGIVLDDLDAVVVTSAAEPDASRVIDLVCEFVIPALSPNGDPVDDDPSTSERLSIRASALSSGSPAPDALGAEEASRAWEAMGGTTVRLPPNRESLLPAGFLGHIYTSRAQEESRKGVGLLSLGWDGHAASLSYEESGVSGSIPLGLHGATSEGTMRTMWGATEVGASARWRDGGTIELRVQPLGSEYWKTVLIEASGTATRVTFRDGPAVDGEGAPRRYGAI